MATTIKETSTLNVIFADTSERILTKKLDYPVAGLSLAAVRTAFAPMFSATNTSTRDIFKNPNSGFTLNVLKGAEYVDTRVTTTTLE